MLARRAPLPRHATSGRVVPSRGAKSIAKYKLPSPFTVSLSSLRPAPRSRPKKTIVGRGIGSGLGKTCGKGHKGQWSRNAPPDWFEGGQTPLYRRVRKFGFKNPFRKPLAVLNLSTVQSWYDRGMFAAGDTITMHTIFQRKLLSSIKHGVKLLANGKERFTAPLHLEVTAVSKAAREALEGAGGSVKTIYLNDRGLLEFLRKDAKDISMSFAAAPPKKASRFDVPKFELSLPSIPPKGVSYNRWQNVLKRRDEAASAPAPNTPPSSSSPPPTSPPPTPSFASASAQA